MTLDPIRRQPECGRTFAAVAGEMVKAGTLFLDIVMEMNENLIFGGLHG